MRENPTAVDPERITDNADAALKQPGRDVPDANPVGITADAVTALKQLREDAATANPVGITANAVAALKQFGRSRSRGCRHLVFFGLRVTSADNDWHCWLFVLSWPGIPLQLIFLHFRRGRCAPLDEEEDQAGIKPRVTNEHAILLWMVGNDIAGKCRDL